MPLVPIMSQLCALGSSRGKAGIKIILCHTWFVHKMEPAEPASLWRRGAWVTNQEGLSVDTFTFGPSQEGQYLTV